MIVNFWVWSSPGFKADLIKILAEYVPGATTSVVGSFSPTPADVYTKLNSLNDVTRRALGNAPNVNGLVGVLPLGLRSIYHRGESLSDFVPIRDDLLDLEHAYYPDFWVGGAWHYETGQPVGGSGSPWFTHPQELKALMPNGYYEDFVLLGGQKPRAFFPWQL